MPSWDVFVSFSDRDAGDRQTANAIVRALREGLGDDRVFLDADELPKGPDWQRRLVEAVRSVRVLVLVVGRRWSDPRLLERLNDDPEHWVRRELELAFDHGVPVITCRVSGAALPEPDRVPASIRRAFDLKKTNVLDLHLGEREYQEAAWKLLVKNVRKLMKAAPRGMPGGPLAPSADARREFERVLCRLDRVKASGTVVRRRSDGDRLFHVLGGDRQGAESFALRCAVERHAGESAQGADARVRDAETIRLDWLEFAETDDAQLRRGRLIADLMGQLGHVADGGHGLDPQRQVVRWLRENNRPTVLFSVASRWQRDLCNEWLALWEGWLHEARPRETTVLLFFDPCLRARWLYDRLPAACRTVPVRPWLGRVRRASVVAWAQSRHVRHALGNDRARELSVRKAASRVYARTRWSTLVGGPHFQELDDALWEWWQRRGDETADGIQ